MRPRTKHIGLKYHHFRSKLIDGMISVHRVDTKIQHEDLLTKALAEQQFVYLRKKIMGWQSIKDSSNPVIPARECYNMRLDP